MSGARAARIDATRRRQLRALRWSRLSLLLWCCARACLATDARLRDVLYDVNEVYRLPAYAGYATDIEFEPGERFVGLGAGDLQGLAFSAQRNHLFIKPRAVNVHTDITVLTDRRVYHFDYVAIAHAPDASHADLLYALRFLYPGPPGLSGERLPSAASAQAGTGASRSRALEALLAASASQRPRNENYGFCGARELQPLAAWDDGVQTHLRFSRRQDMPALFLKNADGSESLLNFHLERDEVIIHRVVRRLILRRGALAGCVINHAYGAEPLAATPGATISPRVQRQLRGGEDD